MSEIRAGKYIYRTDDFFLQLPVVQNNIGFYNQVTSIRNSLTLCDSQRSIYALALATIVDGGYAVKTWKTNKTTKYFQLMLNLF